MKNALIAILIVANIFLAATNILLFFEVQGLKTSYKAALDEAVQKMKAEFDAALTPQALAARAGEEAGKSMKAFQDSLAASYEQLRAQAQKTAQDLRAAAEPVLQDMRAKTSKMGQDIGASTQRFGEAIEEQSKGLNPPPT